MSVFEIVLHVLAVLVVPPVLVGLIPRVKALVAGRQGPPLLQPYRDLWRLLNKDLVLSETTTWVFRAGPVVALVTTVLAALLVPLGSPGAPIAFDGDLVLFAYLLALGRFFTVLAALDTGSPFEGMGAAREATWACLAEPALFLGLLTGVRLTGGLSLSEVVGPTLPALWTGEGAPLVLVVIALFIVLLAENSRIPFDDPTTHLELTMVHEVMVLDHSGPLLALVQYGAAIKLFVFSALLGRLVVPYSGHLGVDWVLLLGATVGVAVVVGVVESTQARLQLPKVPRMLISACLLAGFGLILVSR
jgi:formate hydrogenlyase subunit 4